MLLALADDSPESGADGVPTGDTQMEIPIPPGLGADEPTAKNAPTGETPKDKGKDAAPKSTVGDTADAAKSILEKMMRRPRT